MEYKVVRYVEAEDELEDVKKIDAGLPRYEHRYEAEAAIVASGDTGLGISVSLDEEETAALGGVPDTYELMSRVLAKDAGEIDELAGSSWERALLEAMGMLDERGRLPLPAELLREAAFCGCSSGERALILIAVALFRVDDPSCRCDLPTNILSLDRGLRDRILAVIRHM